MKRFCKEVRLWCISKTAASRLVWQISSTAWIIRRHWESSQGAKGELEILSRSEFLFCKACFCFVHVLSQFLYSHLLPRGFVALTPLNGRWCWRTVRCLIRSIYPLISFSLYPNLTYSSLETNITGQELPLFAATRTFNDMDQTTSSTSYPILLTNG